MNRQDLVLLLRRGFDAIFSNKRIALAVLALLLFLLFFGPRLFGYRSRSYSSVSEAAQQCLESALRTSLEGPVARFEAEVFYPHHQDQDFIPFIGNGYFGFSPWSPLGSETRVGGGPDSRSLSLSLDLSLVVDVDLPGFRSSEAFLTSFRDGAVTHFKSYAFTGDCVTISSQYYAHRRYPTILVQDIFVENTHGNPVDLLMGRKQTNWKDVTTIRIPVREDGVEYELLTKPVPLPDAKGKVLVAAVALPKLDTNLKVAAKNTLRVQLISGFDTSEPASEDVYSNHRNALERQLTKTISGVKSMDIGQVWKQHSHIWNQLSKPGVSISLSKAPEVLNGDRINRTMYYVLSDTPAPLHEADLAPSGLLETQRALYSTERCYMSHNTLLYPSRLWPALASVKDVVDLAFRWKLTLEKKGSCHNIMKAGADGVVQAMLLSFGALKFTHHHLEFGMRPRDLHRNYNFRSINYGNGSVVDIDVEVTSDNKAVLYVRVTHRAQATPAPSKLTPQPPAQRSPSFFACDAGCLDPPQQLSSERVQFPVKLTDPETAILYITEDRDHIADLKHTIHVSEVIEAPAHGHDVIAMHRHGHRLGGLPAMFWFSLVFLVLVFHLFLCKMIYNEYCKEPKSYYYPRGRYAV